MDPFTGVKLLVGAVKAVNWALGDKCPRCGTSDAFSQEDKGKTWFTGKRKVKCGKCGEVFKVAT